MLKEHAIAVRRLLIVIDAVIAAAVFVWSYAWVDGFRALFPFYTYASMAPLYVILWVVLLHHFGLYRSFRTRGLMETVGAVWKAELVGFILFGSAVFMLRAFHFSRIVLITAFLLTGTLVAAQRLAIIGLSRFSRSRGRNYRNLLIVGTGRRAKAFLERVQDHGEWGMRVVGLIDADPALKGQEVMGYPVLGSFADILEVIHSNVVDEVVFVVPRSWLPRIEEPMQLCETEGLQVSLALDIFDLKLSRGRTTDLDGVPLLRFDAAPDHFWRLAAKRTIDIALSSLMLVASAPILGAIALVIRLGSRGPILFRQQRCGLNGRRFTLYKFRTMVQDAEARLNNLLGQNEMQGPVFKLTRDPRVTGIGRFLRRTSLDELPQLWNVLRGEMSLVGPRPPLPTEVQRYDAWQRRKLSMRPGLTCLWQVNGRNNIKSFHDWVRLDLAYIDNWSLRLDWKILLMTVPTVVFGFGAK